MSSNFSAWIERRANEMRGLVGLEETAPLNPHELAQVMGAQIFSPYEVFGMPAAMLEEILVVNSSSWSGGTIQLPDGSPVIVLNPTHANTRERATLMEELAHIHLRHKPSSLIMFEGGLITMRSYNESQEKQAYGAGAAALVPRTLLEYAQKNKMGKAALAKVCGVSAALITFRERVTGIRLDGLTV